MSKEPCHTDSSTFLFAFECRQQECAQHIDCPIAGFFRILSPTASIEEARLVSACYPGVTLMKSTQDLLTVHCSKLEADLCSGSFFLSGKSVECRRLSSPNGAEESYEIAGVTGTAP